MFNEVFAMYDEHGLETFIESLRKKYNLKQKTEDISALIIEAMKEEAPKRKKNNMSMFGISDEQMAKVVIKADALVPKWKASKDRKVEKDEKPVNKTVGNTYFDKKGQKHTKKTEKKGEKFDYTQLELFDL